MTDPHAPPDAAAGTFRPAVVLLAAFMLLSVAYTLAVATIAAVIGPRSPADLVLDATTAAAWAGPEWFHGRPTAAADGVSGGSNLGPTNPALAAAVAARVAAVQAENPEHSGPVPVDLVTMSASGLDPHLSPAAVRLQVTRVAAAHGLDAAAVHAIVNRLIEPRTFGVLGHPRVNVTRLNAAVRALTATRRPAEADGR